MNQKTMTTNDEPKPLRKVYSYIRFSTPEQIKGDSLRRQFEATEKYVNDHNANSNNKDDQWELDKTLNLRDIGSGYHGNQKALENFLTLVAKGRIKKGSILIVESLDRLSRQKILIQLKQFISILEAEIELITLMDNQRFTLDSIGDNGSQLMISISIMHRAYMESEMKSKRLKTAWKEKRKNQKILTARCPEWLELKKNKKGEYYFDKKNEVVKAIKRIFKMKLEGMGEERIEGELNKSDTGWIPPKNKRNKNGGWRKSYIHKILRNRAVIGEFTPHKLKRIERDQDDKRLSDKTRKELPTDKGKTKGYVTREPVGEPIRDYYPGIITEGIFNRVQEDIENKIKQDGYQGGLTGKAYNLFVHIAKCGFCGAPMHYIDKGKPPKGREYLHCDNSRRNLGCDAKAIRYDEFEGLVFQYLEDDEFDLSKLDPDREEIDTEIEEVAGKLATEKQKLKALDSKIESVVDAMENIKGKGLDPAPLEKRYEKRSIEKKECESQIRIYSIHLTTLKYDTNKLKDNLEKINEVNVLLAKAKDKDQKINLRLRIRTELRHLLKQIKVYPITPEPKFKKGTVQIQINGKKSEYPVETQISGPYKPVEGAGKVGDVIMKSKFIYRIDVYFIPKGRLSIPLVWELEPPPWSAQQEEQLKAHNEQVKAYKAQLKATINPRRRNKG